MFDKKKKEKELYKDAMFYKLKDKGHSSKKAEFLIKRFFKDK
jgi:hypothetical protein